MPGPSPSKPDHWSADSYSQAARFVTELGQPVLDLLGPVDGLDVLDIGCGDGVMAAALAGQGARVVGVDSSPDMVGAARNRGIDARLADAHALDFHDRFDACLSNAALHWMVRPHRVAQGVARALRPGGLFVAEFGGHGNVAAVRTALIAVLAEDHGIETDLNGIWYFPTPQEHAAVLEAAGFDVEEIGLHPRPTPVPAGIEAWLTVLAAPALALIDADRRDRARARVARLLAPALRDSAGNWTADYVRLRFRARLRKDGT